MSSYAERFDANADQAEYWNDNAGPKWVAHQRAMDTRLAPLTEELLRRAAPQPGERVLDVGCGTGTTTLALAEAVGGDGTVLALDISEPMLDLTRERCGSLSQVSFVNADAQVHPFDAPIHDLLFSRFGVMFFTDPYTAFANLAGALRPGGRLCFVCWAPMEANPWLELPLEVALRHLEAPEPTPPRTPGPLAFSDPDYVRDILHRAGLEEISVDTFRTVMAAQEPARAQAEFFVNFGPAARLIAAQRPSPDTIEALTADLSRALERFESDEGIQAPATVYYVTAVRP